VPAPQGRRLPILDHDIILAFAAGLLLVVATILLPPSGW
jgi:hypothetical protein